MSDTVKRQHMVWRHYLAPWSDNPKTTKGHIFVFDKEKKEIRNDNLENVAVEKYAYDISGMNKYDLLVMNKFYEEWKKSKQNKDTRNIILNGDYIKKDFLEKNYIGETERRGIKILDDLKAGRFPFDAKNDIWQQLKLLRETADSLFSGHTPPKKFEEWKKKVDEEMQKHEDEQRFRFFEFLLNQLFRSSKYRQVVVDIVEKRKNDEKSVFGKTTDYLFPLMMLEQTLTRAIDLCEKCYCVEIFINKTPINFITSDCPVYVFKYGNKTDGFYYPIDTRCAIRCVPVKDNSSKIVTDSQKIKDLNKLILKYAERQVFAATEKELKEYANN